MTEKAAPLAKTREGYDFGARDQVLLWSRA